MKEQPLLSIVVPTKNRAKYAGPCVRSLLRLKAPDLEVVVQDNSDDVQTKNAIEVLLDDPRLLYNYTAESLSMSDNFTKGFEIASGEYIAFLGDDDGVNPELVEAVRWAKAEGLDALVGCSAARYLWPDVTFAVYGKLLSSTLLIKPFSATATYPDPEAEIHKCVRTAGAKFGRLPKAYHGVVRHEYLHRIRQKAGTYFPGPTPDMATSVALACVLERYVYIDYPLFISGTGQGSGGGAGTEKKHDWSLESVPWFSRRAINLWSDIVPRFCCGTTLWSEDVIQAVQAMGRGEVLRHFNAVFLYARCVAYHRHHNSQTLKTFGQFVRKRRLSRIWAVSSFTYYYLFVWAARLSSLVSNILMIAGLSRTRRISSVIDIDQAIDAFITALHATDRHFDERLTYSTMISK